MTSEKSKKPVDLSQVIRDSAPTKGDKTNTTTRRRSTTLSQAAAAARKTLSPKYVQLRGDQQIELDVLARELQASRTVKVERITANTVIRVATDFVLGRRDVLVGDTEEELLASLVSYVGGLEKDLEAARSKLRELEEAQSAGLPDSEEPGDG
ncbi:hypothetical protein ACFV1W_30200 [Kitasatospora sp. NPDC059648]|uniref:hypothetical protein n=1 Tax=Kitasatospora sp. NPDC059648 TaxID=3346894 RepID=UPI00369495B5